MHFLVRHRQDRAQHDMIAAGGQSHDLPSPGEFLRQVVNRQILDQHAEQPLVQAVRQIEFFEASTRVEPCFRHQEQYRLATVRRLVERAFPAFSGYNAALRVEIEENLIFPALIRQPVAQGDRVGIVRARMAQKNARHNNRPEGVTAPEQAYRCRRRLSRCSTASIWLSGS